MSKDFLQSLQDPLVNYLFAVLGDKYSIKKRKDYFLIKLVREEISLDLRNRAIFVLSPFLESIAQRLECT